MAKDNMAILSQGSVIDPSSNQSFKLTLKQV